VILATGLMSSCGGGKTTDTAPETTTTTEQAAVINTTHAYICPMNCENSASMVAGVCPVCGMDLVANPNYQPATPDTTKTAAPDTGNAGTGHEGHNH
jgi:hypothetical protein